jgi:predicted AAA+ superfamily ATPase
MSKDDIDDLRMYPILDDEEVMKLPREFKPPVQKPPFVKVLLGTRGSGKTATLVNECMRH